ncbi:transmembrane protein 42 isoform X2 [Lycorma delicatula]|uniref:transmembrane protein 42 isoform X2 n=1 Tax=Lycorma delicatula TaxID=130591 RepID=UPI003F516A1D
MQKAKVGQLFLKSIFILMMLTSNAAVWTYYVKALQASSTSLVPTIISTASNYIVSALAGFLIFKEQLSFLWCCGMFLVISGLALVTESECKENNIVNKTKKE